ncbi:hypothetical protein GCK72_021048 [Caenorhabditis remanei]|uniref:Uncharacterized protein n=1 Tax=Caenorhabditis remanei TaxID=31234 RepID=A0A6A5GIT7_CAERE|nr:hypothetical protein GCK72_021048 [Caenorhabditis remanei]KAF1754485.1 hypothetical protein GCK72_021048 [Caenorhabditis remanei]
MTSPKDDIFSARPLTAAEIAAQKRKGYSEEAWRRYQEYQKQWKKFRQTQKTPAPGASTSASTSKQSGASPEGGGQAGTGPSTRSQIVTSVASGKISPSTFSCKIHRKAEVA